MEEDLAANVKTADDQIISKWAEVDMDIVNLDQAKEAISLLLEVKDLAKPGDIIKFYVFE